MENHPIPQDVSHFQFRLIGDITLKQFGYLIAGAILCVIVFFMPVYIIFRVPVVTFIALTAIFFAFIPVEGRPADVMLYYFVKAFFSSTQYIYQKTNPISPALDAKIPDKKEKGKVMIQATPLQPSRAEEPSLQLSPIDIPLRPSTSPSTTPPHNVAPEKKEEAIAEKAPVLNIQIPQEDKVKATVDAGTAKEAHEKAIALEESLHSVQGQKQDLEQELTSLKKQLSQKQQDVYTPSMATAPKVSENVKRIPKTLASSTGILGMTDAPNLISGIVKDSRGNILPNILIEVKDKENNPVRAFKTNPLGQFASATPLQNGTYTISFDDPQKKHNFDTVEIVANGEILLPFEVISVDKREELRKELFG